MRVPRLLTVAAWGSGDAGLGSGLSLGFCFVVVSETGQRKINGTRSCAVVVARWERCRRVLSSSFARSGSLSSSGARWRGVGGGWASWQAEAAGSAG